MGKMHLAFGISIEMIPTNDLPSLKSGWIHTSEMSIQSVSIALPTHISKEKHLSIGMNMMHKERKKIHSFNIEN
jgi:hypothetical protein